MPSVLSKLPSATGPVHPTGHSCPILSGPRDTHSGTARSRGTGPLTVHACYCPHTQIQAQKRAAGKAHKYFLTAALIAHRALGGYKECSILPTLLMTLLRRFCMSRSRLYQLSDREVTSPRGGKVRWHYSARRSLPLLLHPSSAPQPQGMVRSPIMPLTVPKSTEP